MHVIVLEALYFSISYYDLNILVHPTFRVIVVN